MSEQIPAYESHYKAPTDADPDVRLAKLRDFYMRGMCSVFAYCLHRRTGWPVYGVYQRGPDSQTPPRDGFHHAVCLAPDGYVDASGSGHTADDVVEPFVEMSRWYGMEARLVEVDPEEMRRRYRRPEWS